MSMTLAVPPLGLPLFGFKARTPVRDFLRSLRRWLTYRPEQRYLGRPAPRPVKR